ncbi:guanine nucleotide binding protein, alpha subunit [Gorgonomyces haynaldii]|nr:guanine nucleotide binding protein, alpha subunit [Gorgonomyces haynaldii]
MSNRSGNSLPNLSSPPSSILVEIYQEQVVAFPPVVEQLKSESQSEKKAAKLRSMEIDKMLSEGAEKLDPSKHLMLLLLGPADSGKTTVLKQLMILHGKGFSKDDKLYYRQLIHTFIIKNVKAVLIRLAQNGYEFDSEQEEQLADVVSLQPLLPSEQYPASSLEAVKRIIDLPVIMHMIQKGHEAGLDDSIGYFLEEHSRVLDVQFEPSEADILQCRRKTEQISEHEFEIESKIWHFVDVAGQIDKRQKWAAYFDKNLAGLLFIVSVASYCQKMEENPVMNRLNDAMQLFESLLNHPVLKLRSMIVFFNKADLLQQRIKKYPIRDYIPAYTDRDDPKAFLKYIANIFQQKGAACEVGIRTHITTATDVKLMRKVITSVKEFILKGVAQDLGIL